MVRSGAHTRGRVAGRLLFASYHCLIDPSSGAAISARTLLPMLGQRGWEARAFCGPRLDFQHAESPEQLLCDQRIAYAEQAIGSAGLPCRLLEYAEPYLAGTIFVPDAPPRRWASPEEAGVFLDRFATVLDKFHPDVVLTYGGSALTLALMQRARQCGARVVFWLQNLAYSDRRLWRSKGIGAAAWYSPAPRSLRRPIQIPETAPLGSMATTSSKPGRELCNCETFYRNRRQRVGHRWPSAFFLFRR